MWTSIALVCATTLLLVPSDVNAQWKPKYTRLIETQLPNPSTVRLGSALYTVSKTVQYLSVNSTSGKSCRLRVNPLDENIQGRLQATSLNDDRRFLVSGIGKRQGTSRYHILLIVDPNKCSYHAVILPVETGVQKDWPSFPAQIVVQDRSREFRVFYPQGSDCSPCRFNYDGKILAKDKPLEDYRFSEPASQFWIDSYLRTSRRDRYFYLFNFANGTSTVHVMDSNYRTLERMHFNHTVEAASVKMGSYQNTAICFKSTDKRRVICQRLDMQLQPGLTWELPSFDNGTVTNLSVNVDDVGNTFIGVLTTRKLYFLIYDVLGISTISFGFGEVDENYTHSELKGIPLDNEFCLEVVAYRDNVSEPRHVVKCIYVSEYAENNLSSVR